MAERSPTYSVLLPEDQRWRESNIMKIPNTNLLDQLAGTAYMGGRLWRLPAFSANTWHKHIDQWEFYFVLEGTGRIRVETDTLTLPRYSSVLVPPWQMRQVFNDTSEEVLWLILGAPQEGTSGRAAEASDFYPEDPTTLPPQLAGRVWPPKGDT
jgi:mannose-6-phosphate isomerase-like protein (cupin superfamily)